MDPYQTDYTQEDVPDDLNQLAPEPPGGGPDPAPQPAALQIIAATRCWLTQCCSISPAPHPGVADAVALHLGGAAAATTTPHRTCSRGPLDL